MADLKSSVHGKQEYMDLNVFFNYIQVFVFFSYFYVAVTFGIVYKMCRMYYSSRVFNKTTLVHGSLFDSFLWMQMANFAFFVFDNLVFRLPSTGLLTSLCASISPSHFLKVLYMLQLLTSYSSLFYSLLFCITRLIIVFFPDRHRKISSQIVFFLVPFTFIFPLCADFYLLPAEGYCRQLGAPYPFGSISVSFTETWFNIRTDRCMLYLSFITPAIVILVNGVLIYKVRSWLFHKKMTRSQKSRRAQISLTVTTLAISIQFLASGGKTVVGLVAPDFATYALLIRNPLMDFGMVLVPWLFYLSHPMFHNNSNCEFSITNNWWCSRWISSVVLIVTPILAISILFISSVDYFPFQIKMYNSIHNQPEFISFEYSFNFVSLVVFSSYFLIIATAVVVIRMCKVYYWHKGTNTVGYIHRNLFNTFVCMEISNLFFFVFDNLVFRLPSTGILTSLCASISPNHYLKLFYMFQLFTNYFSMFYSFLFCIVRLLIVYFPEKHEQYCSKLFKVYIPLTIILPIIFDFFMVPALGYCRTLPSPYPNGSIFISFTETWLGLRTDPMHFPFSLGFPLLIVIVNVALALKIRKTVVNSRALHNRSTYRSEVSLTCTTLAIIVPFLANASMTFVSLFFRDLSSYVLLIRCPLTDFSTVLVPWIFFLSHPLFSNKAKVHTVSHT